MNTEETAKKIAEYLFTNGKGERAQRLVFELKNGKDGGGWSEHAVTYAIKSILKDSET